MKNSHGQSGSAGILNYAYLLPAIILITVFFIMSTGFTIYVSFFEWDGFSPMVFTGIKNYIEIFKDANFLQSFINTLIWVGCALILNCLFPLLFALLITNSSFLSFFKYVFYLPSALAGVVGGLIIRNLLSIHGIPTLMSSLGFENLRSEWLAIPYVNTFIMIIMGVWSGLGLNMILFIVGLRSMAQDPIEAAIIDGAGAFKRYWYVVFPMLETTFKVVILMTLVNTFKVFDGIWIMTKGGPFRTSETLALTMYVESFVRNHMGFGASVAVVLTIIILVISYFQLKKSFAEDKY
ncbi:MAG: sugar ABC transporter permease [Spirochaetaceae bacterium]|jgi:multiple sugar transport system permease protein|nr:sugar ABC transporter permease [Spirochaetaceae bacterium]